jgi:hypothetical protein
VNPANDVMRDRERRRLNQHAFRRHFVDCSCELGCPVCAYTGLVSRAEARQMGERDSALASPAGPHSS